jgi:hypothetical protein
MRLIFQKEKPRAEQGGSSTWVTALTQPTNLPTGNFNHQHSSQTRDVIGSGSGNRGSLYKCQIRSSPSHNIGRIRASSAPHAIGNRQHHCHRIQQWHNKTKTHKSNGHALLLDKRQSQTRSIQCVLGPRIPKFGRLFHKTPFAGASQKNARNIYTCK